MQRHLLNTDIDTLEKEYADVVIIGSGIAGVYTALELDADVQALVISKDTINISNSSLAQGGIAVSLDKKDSPALHYEDTIFAGAGLCKSDSVWVLVNEAAKNIEKLCEYGVNFDRKSPKELALTREAAHSMNRIIHAGDTTGKEVCEKLVAAADVKDNIRFKERVFAIDVLTNDDHVIGVLVYEEATRCYKIYVSDKIVCAAGGFGRLYKNTTNPEIATGDGVAMCYRAGAGLADMEFIQFHPTVLHHPKDQHFLISEAVRGEGALLRNQKGELFMEQYHSLKELAPRDVVARAIFAEMKKENAPHMFLDITFQSEAFLKKRFPNIYATCLSYGIDISKDYIPVAPAEHYCMGGIATDEWGQTGIKGLYACGEAACTGIHGANRLASNSLLEGLVFGGKISQKINESKAEEASVSKLSYEKPVYQTDMDADDEKIKEQIRTIMTEYVGIIRDRKSLLYAQEKIRAFSESIEGKAPKNIAQFEVINMLSLAKIIVSHALLREESRGGHYRSDFQSKRKDWEKRIVTDRKKGVFYED